MKVDLNLLRVFDAVMAERNVTAAAARLGLSQSAVSAALARLRDMLGVELFVRARYGVVPTAQALEMAPKVAHALSELEQVFLDSSTFDPATAERRFAVAANAYFECILIPELMVVASTIAPKISVVVNPLAPNLQETDLANDKIDLALGRFAEPPENLVVADLLEDSFLCLVRTSDAPSDVRLSKRAFEAMKHVVVAPPGRWRTGVFQQLEQAGLKRQVLLTVSHFLATPIAVLQTGACATLPRRIAELYRDDDRFRLLEPPSDLGTFPLQMAWHPHHRRDAGHQWLRKLVMETCENISVG